MSQQEQAFRDGLNLHVFEGLGGYRIWIRTGDGVAVCEMTTDEPSINPRVWAQILAVAANAHNPLVEACAEAESQIAQLIEAGNLQLLDQHPLASLLKQLRAAIACAGESATIRRRPITPELAKYTEK